MNDELKQTPLKGITNNDADCYHLVIVIKNDWSHVDDIKQNLLYLTPTIFKQVMSFDYINYYYK